MENFGAFHGHLGFLGIFYGSLVFCGNFGFLYQEKSGNPAWKNGPAKGKTLKAIAFITF
jgi:hypothetical protein